MSSEEQLREWISDETRVSRVDPDDVQDALALLVQGETQPTVATTVEDLVGIGPEHEADAVVYEDGSQAVGVDGDGQEQERDTDLGTVLTTLIGQFGNEGGDVLFRSGVYTINSTVTIPESVAVQGTAYGSTVLEVGASEDLFVMNGTDGVLRDVTFRDPNNIHQPDGNVAIRIDTSGGERRNLLVEDIVFDGMARCIDFTPNTNSLVRSTFKNLNVNECRDTGVRFANCWDCIWESIFVRNQFTSNGGNPGFIITADEDSPVSGGKIMHCTCLGRNGGINPNVATMPAEDNMRGYVFEGIDSLFAESVIADACSDYGYWIKELPGATTAGADGGHYLMVNCWVASTINDTVSGSFQGDGFVIEGQEFSKFTGCKSFNNATHGFYLRSGSLGRAKKNEFHACEALNNDRDQFFHSRDTQGVGFLDENGDNQTYQACVGVGNWKNFVTTGTVGQTALQACKAIDARSGTQVDLEVNTQVSNLFRTGEASRVVSDPLRLRAEDDTNEGGEVLLEGAGSYKNWVQDVYQDQLRWQIPGEGQVFRLENDPFRARLEAPLNVNAQGLEGLKSGSGSPSTTDIPDDQWALWKDTDTNTVSLYYNDGGTLKSVDLS
jgi:hypothetical protein